MLYNYFAPVGNDITKEYLPCSLSQDGYYHLDYMVAENASGKKYVAWPGRVSRPVTGIGTTLFATSDSGMKLVRSSGAFAYSGGTGNTPWGTHYTGSVLLGLKDKYSTGTLSPGDTVPKMKIVQSETYSLIQPLLTRCSCQFATQSELNSRFGNYFLDCPNSMYINTNLTTLQVGAGMLLSATAALTTPKMVMKYALWQGGVWNLSLPTEVTLTKYFEQNGIHYYYASVGVDIDQGASGKLLIGFPYAYFDTTNDVITDGFTAMLNSVYLHIV